MSVPKPNLFRLPENGEIQLPVFESCSIEEVPEPVVQEISHEMLIEEIKEAKMCKPPLRLNFGENGQMFVLAYSQERPEFETNYGVYAVDIGSGGEVMGMANSILETEGTEADKPFVQFTRNAEDFHKQGLALRRLIVLNEVNRMFFNLSLGSGSFSATSDNARKTWERLAAAGLALKLDEDIYRFK